MTKKFEVKTAFLYQCILELPYFEYGCLVGQPRREEVEAGTEEALMSNLCLISHHCYDVEKLTASGSSNLKLNFSWTQQKDSSKIVEGGVTFLYRS